MDFAPGQANTASQMNILIITAIVKGEEQNEK